MEISNTQKKIAIGIGGGIIGLCIILSAVFYSAGTKKVISEQTMQATLTKNNEYTELVEKLEQVRTELSTDQSLLNELNDYKATKDAKTLEIQQLDADISTKSAELASINTAITSKSAELEQLKSTIIKTGEAPKIIPAGHYTVGTDLQPGRYSVTGSSNFVVYSSSGNLKVNTILGDGDFGEESYTCNLNQGDTLKLSSKTTFTPVK